MTIVVLVACSGPPAVENAAPEVSVLSPADGAVVAVGEAVGVEGEIHDDSNDGIDAVWTADPPIGAFTALTELDLADGLSTRGTWTAESSGTVTLILGATDEEGLEGEDRVEVVVE